MVGKKKIHCEGRIEKSVPRDHRFSSLGKPRDDKRQSTWQFFLSYSHTHDSYIVDFLQLHAAPLLLRWTLKVTQPWLRQTVVRPNSANHFIKSVHQVNVTVRGIWRQPMDLQLNQTRHTLLSFLWQYSQHQIRKCCFQRSTSGCQKTSHTLTSLTRAGGIVSGTIYPLTNALSKVGGATMARGITGQYIPQIWKTFPRAIFDVGELGVKSKNATKIWKAFAGFQSTGL